jgi:hypothetical protein
MTNTTNQASGPTATGTQLASTINAVIPVLQKVQALMLTPAFANVVVMAEDVEYALAVVGVPGAAVAEQITEDVASDAPTVLSDVEAGAPLFVDWLAITNMFSAVPGPGPDDGAHQK